MSRPARAPLCCAAEEERRGRLEATPGIEPGCTDLQSMRQRHLING